MQKREKTIPGVDVVLSGDTYTVPPLTLGQVKRLTPTLTNIQSLVTGQSTTIPAEALDAIVDVAYEALNRNYECTKEELFDLIDVAVGPELIMAVMGASQMKPKEHGSGEA